MTDIAQLRTIVEGAFEERQTIGVSTRGEVRDAVEAALELLDSGKVRVAEKQDGGWVVNQWLKKAVLLSFRLNDMELMPGRRRQRTGGTRCRSKFDGWGENRFRDAGFRAVPGCIVRRSAYIAPGVVLMPSFVNLGAYVDEGTMVDTWATVGSCAQIGKRCHISGGAGIGGVLEPLQAGPVDHRGQLLHRRARGGGRGRHRARGLGAVDGRLSSAPRPRIVDRATGKVSYGEVPPYSVVVSGSLPGRRPGGPAALLRGHREAGRRADARKDRRSTNSCATEAAVANAQTARGAPR